MQLNFEIPDLTGKNFIVTGANSGIGLEEARTFAAHSATVIMACRSLDKAHSAVEDIRAGNPEARLELMELDLACLESVRHFAESYTARYDKLDVLVNNAGVMVPPDFRKTVDGFELQFGTNHLGHFALTGQLLPLIINTHHTRIVNVSSLAHHMGKFDRANLNTENGYRKTSAYGLSKLANLLFTYELQRRLTTNNINTIAVAAHPGWTATNLQRYSSGFRLGNKLFAQTPVMGALPTIRAAVAPDVQGGEYYGPKNWGGWRGPAVKVKSNGASKNETDARELWSISEKLTGVTFNFETKIR